MISRPGVCMLVLLLSSAQAGARQLWRLEPNESRLEIVAVQAGQRFTAQFKQFTAEIAFDPADSADSQILVAVNLGSLATGDSTRDRATQAPEVLHTGRFPEARYRTLAFEALGQDRYAVSAELTLKGVTRQLQHQATIRISGHQARAEGEVVLHRREFGIGQGQLDSDQVLGPEILVRFSVVAERS